MLNKQVKNQTFWREVKKRLTVEEWESIPGHIGWSDKKMTRMQSGIDDWQMEEIVKMAEILKESPSDLILKYGLGTSIITLDCMNELVKQEGCQIGLIDHAA